MDYWDASALIKLYLPEDDSAYFRKLVSGKKLLTSAIAEAEILCAAYRKECSGELVAGGGLTTRRRFLHDHHAGRVVIVKCDEEVMVRAQEIVELALRIPRPAMLRALDAIHIASAVAARATTIITTDSRLRAVASLARLKVLP